MRTVIQNGEEPLLEYVNRLEGRVRGWHAVHFHLSALQPGAVNKKLNYAAFDLLAQNMKECEGAAFMCRDGDIFVMAMGESLSQIDKAVSSIRLLFASDPLVISSAGDDLNKFTTNYNLTNDYEFFNKVCNFKFACVARMQRDNPKILLIEDSPFSRDLLRQTLIPTGYEIFAAEDGPQGIQLFMTKAPDIIFLDIGLPHMNGYDVLRKITDVDPNAFVVMLTASRSSDDVRRAVELGAKGYVAKPFKVGKLQAYIRQYLEQNRLKASA